MMQAPLLDDAWVRAPHAGKCTSALPHTAALCAAQESRRIDNQLRGRSGRQGDPGSTRFFLSLEDKCAL